jgi:acyl-CoA synthetase (AMP-forming)/AMP-acid ligase II
MIPMTMDYLLVRALRTYADRVALVEGSRETTYGELDVRTTRLANGLIEAHISRGDRVSILMKTSIDFLEAELTIIKAGMVKVPINPRLSLAEIVYILKDCGVRALFLDPEYEDRLLSVLGELPDIRLLISKHPVSSKLCAHDELATQGSDAPVHAERSPEDLYLLRYTGGTTGRPKGIMHTHTSCVAIALSVIREYAISADERYLQVAHLSHGASFVWPAFFVMGARIFLVSKFDPSTILELIQEHRITRVNLVPTMLNAVVNELRVRDFDVSSLRLVTYSSASMPVERLREALSLLGPRLLQVYTLSESAVISTILRKEDHVLDGLPSAASRLASCGREALDVQLRIIDTEGKEVPVGVVGEIILKSPGNMMGYWNQPDLTAQVMRDGWVHTGDLARRDEAGYVYLVDRKHDMIISGAFNIYPREIEEVLYLHPAVHEAAVIGIPHEKWGEAPAAFVSLWPDASCTAQDLIAWCGSQLASYKKPIEVNFLPDLPKSPVGKILRRALRDPYWVGRTRQIA